MFGIQILSSSVYANGLVDPGLVGTWQLPNQSVYWEIRADGTYQLSTGGKVIHSGIFSASYGTWSIYSETWGEDGGEYQLPNPDTFVGTGKMGPATWKRARQRSTKKTNGEIILSTQRDGIHALPKDIPELIQTSIRRASAWQPDAVPVSVDFKQIDAPNMKGPEIRITFVSPFQFTGMMMLITEKGSQIHEFKNLLDWNGMQLPLVFVDLPTALNIARKNGMKGPLKKAGLRIWNPNGAPPVLAWVLNSGASSGGKTVDAASGQIITFDVTGYIEQYNDQWNQAAYGLQALIRKTQPPTPDDEISSWSAESGQPTDNGEGTRLEYERNAAEGRAYWGGSADDYNRIKNGECTWSASTNYGC